MSGEQVERLRDLLRVPDQASQDQLVKRVDGVEQQLEQLPDKLPAALRSADSHGPDLAGALEQPVAKAVETLARTRRELLANALFPVLGPAIRQAITEALRGLVDNLNRLLESTFSIRGLRWRLESWRSGMPYAQVALRHMLRYSVDHLFVIQNESGLLLAKAHQFEFQGNDSDAVAAMLTAIRDFMRDSGLAPGEAELRQVELGDHLLRLYPGPDAYLAAAISGVPGREVDRSLSTLLEDMHRQVPAALEQGQPDPQVDELLRSWFSLSGRSQELEESAQRRPLMAILLISLLTLLALVWIGERLWTGSEATALSKGLAAEPGYQARAQRDGWRQLRVDGLRDPVSRPLTALLSELQLDPERVWNHTQPYLSLSPELVASRLQKLLQPPEGVVIEAAGGQIRIHGEADLTWAESAQLQAASWAGLIPLVWELRSPEPPSFDPLPPMVVVELPQGAELSAEANAELAQVAGWFGADANPSPQLRVPLISETDGVGDPSSNRQLAQLRLKAVQQALVDAGVPLDRLLPGLTRPEVVPGEDFAHRRVRVKAVLLP